MSKVVKEPFLILMGKSGSGKSTVAEGIQAVLGLKPIPTYTSRPPRTPDESSHTFVTTVELFTLPNKVAYTKFDGHYYCTTAEQVEQYDIAVLDKEGVLFFYDQYNKFANGAKQPVTIYLKVGLFKRAQRMLKRGDSLISTIRRLIHDGKAFKGAEELADYIVPNNRLLDCIAETASIYKHVCNVQSLADEKE